MHEFKGAIFDMDGTLLDSMPVWKRLTQGYLKQFGVHITDQDYAVTEGFSQPQVAQYFADRYPELPDAQSLMDGMDRLISARYEAIAKPKEGVLDFLEGLRRRGVKMAIATLTARRHAEKALRDRDMLDYFEFMLTIEDVGISKREPDIYLQAAARMGLEPAECTVFEDAPYACATARRAGFRVCGMVEPAYAAGEDELRASSDLIVEHSFDELRGKI
ncbi:HAD family hydrolase [Agathobaculum sp.]|uniref:HAD family hydrolase n=1 Tax=Agathobaculum sp. TaxID=2048138 RepID=UPI001F95AEF0|nr:HAD family phosphatase [Candidatus Agathobaculum intestinigallinarum]